MDRLKRPAVSPISPYTSPPRKRFSTPQRSSHPKRNLELDYSHSHSFLTEDGFCERCGACGGTWRPEPESDCHEEHVAGELCVSCGACGDGGELLQNCSHSMSLSLCFKCGQDVTEDETPKCFRSLNGDRETSSTNNIFSEHGKGGKFIPGEVPRTVSNEQGPDVNNENLCDTDRLESDGVKSSGDVKGIGDILDEMETEPLGDWADACYETFTNGADWTASDLFASVLKKFNGAPSLLMQLLIALNFDYIETSSLTYLIMLETLQQLSQSSLRTMRYCNKTKTYWKLFQLKFGSSPLRYLAGWKCFGQLTMDNPNKKLDPALMDALLAVPDSKTLHEHIPAGQEWPERMKPGYCIQVAKVVAKSAVNTSMCLSFDAKKVAPGLKVDHGDINLIGHELGKTLEDRKLEHVAELTLITKASDSLLQVDPPISLLCSIITNLSRRRADLLAVLQKKKYALDKLRKDAGPDYRQSRFSFVISMLVATVVEINEALATNIQVIDNVSKIVCHYRGEESRLKWTSQPSVNRSDTVNFKELPDIDVLLSSASPTDLAEAQCIISKGLPFIKQRSSLWFDARKQHVTASRLYVAVGAETITKQKAYFDSIFNGRPDDIPSPEIREAMDHGIKHEDCAVATVCRKFLPVYHKDAVFKEVGGVPIQYDQLQIIVSPDGHVIDEVTGYDAAVEIKCPFFIKEPHQQLPARYYLQVQAHMAALQTEKCLYVSFGQETCNVFEVAFDEEVWQMTMQEVFNTYNPESSHRPGTRSAQSKLLLQAIKDNAKTNCTLISCVKSVHVCEIREATTCSPTSQAVALHTLETCHSHLEKVFQILRQKATEMVAFVVSDLDRINSETRILGVPVCYFLKGYSMPTGVIRNIMEELLDKLYNEGIHIPVVAFDGAFMTLLNRSKKNKPMTLLQLHKDFWCAVRQITKPAMIKAFRQVDDTKYEITRTGAQLIVSLKSGEVLPKYPGNCRGFAETFQPQVPIEHTEDLVAEDVIEMAENVDQDHAQGETAGDDEEIAVVLNSTEVGTTPVPVEDFNILSIAQTLKHQHVKFGEQSEQAIVSLFADMSSLQKFTVPELLTVIKALNIKPPKTRLKSDLLGVIATAMRIEGEYVARKRRNPSSLITLCCKGVSRFPKLVLNVIYCEWKFPSKLEEWNSALPVNVGMTIPGLSEYYPQQWFYSPEKSDTRHQLELKRIDTTHLLTRHRSAINRGNLGPAKRDHFVEVATGMKTQLKIGMLEDNLNMQSTDLARITFSEEVQQQLLLLGHDQSADLCKKIREWFQACDDPGIPAVMRCRMKLEYRRHLSSMVDFASFPPPGSHIQGYPKVLWEATMASIDADILLYSLAKRKTYNQRSVGSQPCEGLFSSLATMPSSHNGTPSCISLESDLGKVFGEAMIRLDSARDFPLRLSKAPVYHEKVLEKDTGVLPLPQPIPTYIDVLDIKNHLFDSRHRKKRKSRKLTGISGLHEPAKGVAGVRSHHKINEGLLNPLVRLGVSTHKSLDSFV